MSDQVLHDEFLAGMSGAEEATARVHILAILHRYAALAREEPDSYEMKKLFEPDGTVEFADGRKFAPDQLREIMSSNPPQLLRHHLTTVDIKFVSSNEVHCQSYVIGQTHAKLSDHWGRWDDVVRRQSDGRWLIQRKLVTGEGMDPEGWLAETIKMSESVRKDTAD